MNLLGIHHITAMASDPAKNVQFYTEVLGQRMIKQTVNFDDPGTYHLYYGDRKGSPGTILTFFPFPDIPRGVPGTGQATAFSYHIPVDSLSYWQERLNEKKVQVLEPIVRFGQNILPLRDHDGFLIELVESDQGIQVIPWEQSDVPPAHALRGFHGVTLTVHRAQRTTELLTNLMGAQRGQQEGQRTRFILGGGNHAAHIDVVEAPELPPGRGGSGTIHHIAWRTPDDPSEEEARQQLTEAGHGVSQVIDRNYFHSIYYREPSGILFEIATDPPGFEVDETEEELGSKLMLPPWMEPRREILENSLPPLPSKQQAPA